MCDKAVAFPVITSALNAQLVKIKRTFALKGDRLSPYKKHRMRCIIAASSFVTLGLSPMTLTQEQVLKSQGHPSRNDCSDEEILAHFYKTFHFVDGDREVCAFGFSWVHKICHVHSLILF